MRFMFKPLVAGMTAAALTFGMASTASAQTTLKISHQFPGGTEEQGDFRDRLVRKFARQVSEKTNGELKFEIYPGASLVKTFAQFGAMQRGSVDMILLPLAYEGGKIPEVNITLMPGLITSYEQGHRWKGQPIGNELEKLLESKGAKVITWIWQAGGIASKKKVLAPDDVKGVKIRGASKHMDLMLKGAGGSITNVPSNEVYNAMQTGVLDAAVTSSTSIISFRLEEVGDHLTDASQNSFWFMFEPLMMSKATFDRLTPAQQKVVMEVGASLEKFSIEESKKDDMRASEVWKKAGKNAYGMDDATFAKWRAVAQKTAWKDFAEEVKNGQKWLDMATAVK
ncbi:MAG TPA: TRAP transporter substrate-binding protein DctP [Limnobacter sp.]|nr:TRAP transporter substrate-binding protein DctP [Limnobacter sp.]